MNQIPAADISQPHTAASLFRDKRTLIFFLLLIVVGASLRLFAPPVFRPRGYDEALYENYVRILNANTLTVYPRLVRSYIAEQKATGETKLPPTRFLYIGFAHGWSRLLNIKPIDALQSVSCIFSILLLPLAGWFAYRLGGPRTALGVLALVACSPMQIYVARHALIDGFFGFWAIVCVWLLWENLQKPSHRGWLAAYTAALTLMVLTKENAFFVFVAILGIFAVNRRAKFGTASRPLVICTFVGGLLGVSVIALLAGGLDYAFETYLLLVRNASHLEYAIRTGDGPWYRYISDLLLMSPLVLLLAVGAIFHLNREKKTQLYLLSFVGFSYLVMCNVQYGMNLRYANMWDMPLRFLAFSQLAAMCARFGKREAFILTLCVVAMCAIDLRQYDIFFVKHELYELIPLDLARSLRMIK
jgi:hypothetical protein